MLRPTANNKRVFGSGLQSLPKSPLAILDTRKMLYEIVGRLGGVWNRKS